MVNDRENDSISGWKRERASSSAGRFFSTFPAERTASGDRRTRTCQTGESEDVNEDV
jgi:hypothetical protein